MWNRLESLDFILEKIPGWSFVDVCIKSVSDNLDWLSKDS